MKKNWIIKRYGTLVVLLIILLATACGPLVPQPAPTRQPFNTAQIPLTGTEPEVIVEDQEFDGSTVVVARVVSEGPGWIAIHKQEDDTLGPPIGFAKVEPGENKGITVKIDPQEATPQLYAMLHVDAGEVGKYEFPGPDVPVLTKEGHQVSPPFQAMAHGATTGLTPDVIVKSQEVINGKVTIEEVTSDGPGWVAIHVLGENGAPGTDIGYSAVKPGKNQNILVTVDPTKVTDTMFAMLHIDGGEIGTYEFPGPDEPVEINGEMVAPSFNTKGIAQAEVTDTTAPETPTAAEPTETAPTAAAPTQNLGTAAPEPTEAPSALGSSMVMEVPSGGPPSSLKVSDQAIVEGKVRVDEVYSNGSGWVVIYNTNNSIQPVEAIGHVAVPDGKSENVMVPIDAAKAKGVLYAQLHVNKGDANTFEFPGPDEPLMVGVQMIAGVFQIFQGGASGAAGSLPTDITPAITVADQAIVDSAVVIPQVISKGDAWVAVHRQDADGVIGGMVGHAPVKNGLNTNVKVVVDTNRTSGIMYALIHADLGEKGKLEFPGPDAPVEVNGQVLAPSFNVTYNSLSDVVINLSEDTGSGVHLVDIRGMSLYVSLNDTRGQSNCNSECQQTWKPLLATGQILAGAGVSSDRFGVIILPTGKRQVTYANIPLYTYVKDEKPGDIKGQGLNGTWFLANP